MRSSLPAGQSGRETEAPVFPGRGFSASAARRPGAPLWRGCGRALYNAPANSDTANSDPAISDPAISDEEPMMALDPDAERVLELARLSRRPPYEMLTPPEARALFLAGRAVLSPEPQPVAEIRALAVPRSDGTAVPLRLYRPLATDAAALLPGLVFFHGGGWVIGDLETHDTLCRHLANASGCAIVSVDYRLAPEHKFPAAVEDCFLATQWIAENGAVLGIDSTRLAVGGDSAGGNLAAVTSLLARERGAPSLRYQLLLYPVLDCEGRHESHARFAEGYLLTRATMRWFADQYLPQPEDATNWRASPWHAADLAGLPPGFVLTAGFDPLADEGTAYARRLGEHGVAVRHRHVPDQIHGFLLMGKIIRAARPELDAAGAALRAGLQAG
jgi:acetyl esterase